MIEFKNVYKTYPNGFTALKDVNLKIEQGEFVAIIGLSGAGKSTILRCINRMHDITKGTLTVDGVDVNSLRGAELRRFRRKVGMIFQSFNLVSRSTAIKNVLTADVPDMSFFKVLFGIFSKDQKMRALESLDKVGILDKAYTRCDQLSGGQQQRVALARTLNQNPKIILADEPVASLDPITARQVMQDLLCPHQQGIQHLYSAQYPSYRPRAPVLRPRDRRACRRDRLRRPRLHHHPGADRLCLQRHEGARAGQWGVSAMENEVNTLVKLTWFDKIFKPQVITLANGHTTIRRRSRAPLILLLLAVAIVLSLRMTGFSLAVIVTKFDKLLDLFVKLFHPKWSFFEKVTRPLVDTIKMSILGTVIGCLLALPVSVLASTNIDKSRVIVSVLRFILALIRTLPTLVIALVCALVFGLGTFAGTLAISVFTFGIVAKMLYESIETIDMGPFEAMEAMGANKFQAFWSACVPQILPVYLSHSLYCFEMNVRASAILGYVGAGGLGITINERIGWRDYEGLGMVLLTLFVVVVAIEFLSEYLRGKLS